jgi:hypothetical protein
MGLLTRTKVEQGDRTFVNHVLAVAFNGAYKIRWDRLDEGEQAALVNLVREANEGGFNVNRLGRSSRDGLEALIEKGSGLPGGFFERTRIEDRQRRELAERDASRRRRPFGRRETTNLFLAFHAEMCALNLFVDDLATIATMLALFAAGKPIDGTLGRFEDSDDGPVLVLNVLHSLAPSRDDGGLLDGLYGRIESLAGQGWFEIVSRSGPTWKLRLGPRLLDALERGQVDDEEAAA